MIQALRDWLNGVDPGFFLLLWVGSAGLTLVLIFLAVRTFIRARIIAHTPTSRLRSAAQGFNELEGRGRALEEQPLFSPLTRTPCLWFDIRVERYRSTGKNKSWVTERHERSDQLFRVEDDTGEAYVDPDHARVIPHQRRRWQERGGRESAHSELIFSGFGQRYRYTEALLLPDMPLYVLGWLETRGHDQSAATRLAAVEARKKELLREWKDDEAARSRFDLDGDGEISPREWEWAMRLAQSKAKNEIAAQPPGDPLHLVRRPGNGDPYIVSGVPQNDLVRRKTWKAGLLVGGAVLTFVFWFVAATTRALL
jgi:hypothetical protein